MTAVWATSCSRGHHSAGEMFERTNQEFLHGYLKQSENDARRGYEEYLGSSPELAWKFRILEAKAALWRGSYEDVSELLDSVPASSDRPDLAIPRLTLSGIANINTHNFADAARLLAEAARLCAASQDASCGYTLQARGLLASEQAQSASANNFYELSLAFARSHSDSFLEGDSLLNLGAESLAQGHFDEAIDRSREGYQVADIVGAEILKLVTQGNLGWASYRLGDSENALELSLQAGKRAAELGDIFDEENELTNIGYIYMDQRQFALAASNFQQALGLAQGIKAKQDEYNALRVLARLSVQVGDPDKASQYAEQASQIARETGNHVDELYPRLVLGQVAAQRGDAVNAQQIFQDVEGDKSCPVFLKWDAQHSLAQLYERRKQGKAADREYRAALSTFESARASVQHEDFQLSFLTNAAHIYDDYVHFLVAQGKTDEALRWADYSRARTLSEGLGLLSNEARGTANLGAAKKGAQFEPPPLDAPAVAAHAKGVILYYWLGENQSYLWAIAPRETRLFTLPPGPEIEAKAQRYRKALTGPTDVLESANEDGQWLYRTLISPAQSLLPKDARAFVIPDGNLNNLNFETLIVSDPAPHYWIEDAVVTDSSSLRVLSASYRGQRTHNRRKMLLIGNSIAPNDQYPALPNAGAQMESVAGHFTDPHRQIFSGAQATPEAYVASHPEQFSHIHFVAHGTASRLSPLDSAIVLSKSPAESDSFKLYARDIIRQPLHADIVTISACYGAGERAYSGEGLVGLAWAFLRAGAHNVIAGLWEVTDASTGQMMDRFYSELDKGSSPDAALRAAKLSLLHGGTFRNPFYWAPFQLYAGS